MYVNRRDGLHGEANDDKLMRLKPSTSSNIPVAVALLADPKARAFHRHLLKQISLPTAIQTVLLAANVTFLQDHVLDV